MHRHLIAAAFGSVVLAAPGMVAAHVTLERQEAAANASYKAVLRVGHGCEGSPTTAIRVQIPEGVIAVKPMPKAGWEVDTVKDKYERPYDYFGSELTENRIDLHLADAQGQPVAAQAAELSFALPELGVEALRAGAAAVAPGRFRGRIDLPFAGEWRVRADLLIDDFTKLPFQARIMIAR